MAGSYPLERRAELDKAERNARWRTLLDERWDERWLAEHPADLALAREAMVDRDELDPKGAHGRRMQMLARSGHDVCERLRAIDSPTLVGCGRYDGIAPLANSRAIASRIRGAELRGYEGDHLFIAQESAALQDFAAFLAA